MGLLGRIFGKKGDEPQTSEGQLLRRKMLEGSPREMGFEPSDEFPKVAGVIADMPMSGIEVSIFGSATADGSLYTSSQFGIIGGCQHEGARKAALELTRKANEFYDEATPAQDTAYPPTGTVRFYLMGFDDLRFLDAPEKSAIEGTHRYSSLYGCAQMLMTQLRIASGG
ncbi:MAG: hypothetical protein JST51_13200 [Armatimonadetes bacterium]|nr:hypothetical protein [Armatimonadota bacterium]